MGHMTVMHRFVILFQKFWNLLWVFKLSRLLISLFICSAKKLCMYASFFVCSCGLVISFVLYRYFILLHVLNLLYG